MSEKRGAAASSVGHVQFGKEQNRATQIMAEKLDVIRMYRWDYLTGGSFVATNITDYYFPSGSLNTQTNEGSSGTVYRGTVSILNAGLTEAYNDQLRKVTVNLQWKSGGRTVNRQMTTFVSKHGLQLYVP